MRCGCREQLGDGTALLKLQTNRPLVCIQGAPPRYTKDDVWSWLKEAHARWGVECDWVVERIDDISDAKPTDYVQVVQVKDLGGTGVLADQVLPYPGGNVLRMRINSRIRWKATDGFFQSGTVDPVRTICHEIGHFQGHQHWPVGDPAELMEPTVSQTTIRPQPTEMKVSIGWFGKAQSIPVPPPLGKRKLIIEFDGPVPIVKTIEVE